MKDEGGRMKAGGGRRKAEGESKDRTVSLAC